MIVAAGEILERGAINVELEQVDGAVAENEIRTQGMTTSEIGPPARGVRQRRRPSPSGSAIRIAGVG